jgi:membrane associated rhomboid family serine protease
MGESDRFIEYKNQKRNLLRFGSDNNALVALIVVNAVFFMTLLFLQVAFFFDDKTLSAFYDGIIKWIELPADFNLFLTRPWTLLTYMFSDTNAGLMRIISNMLWLWAFGYVFQHYLGNERLIPTYIYGGIIGAVVFIAAHYFISPLKGNITHAGLIGANAATMAVAAATTMIAPDHRFFTQIRKGIPIWVLLAVYVIIDFAGVASMEAAHSLSHIGGAIAGVLIVWLLKKGIDLSIWMNQFYTWIINLLTPQKKGSKESIKDKVFYNTGNRKPFSKTMNVSEQKVDEILDKINLLGYDALSEEEKTVLKKASEE